MLPVRLNDWLDTFPRARLRVGSVLLPVYFVTGLTGVGLAALTVLALAVWTGASIAIAGAVSMLACLVFVLFGLARSRLLRSQKIILLEHFLVVEAAAYGALYALELPILPYLDLLTVGLSTFLIFGRLGCFTCGCCYGIASPIGVSYPQECGHPTRLRRLPTQLIEFVGWVFLTLLAIGSVLLRPPGTALTTVLVCYGALRLMLEPLRGDVRPRWLGLTEAAWLSIASIGAAVYLHDRSLPISLATLAGALILAGVIPFALAKTNRLWLWLDLGQRARDEVAAVGVELSKLQIGPAPVARAVGDLIFAASYTTDESGRGALSVSVSSATRKLDQAEAALLLEWMTRGFGIEGSDIHPVQGASGMFLASLHNAPVHDHASGK